MSEYSQYYRAFVARLVHGEGLSPDECRCHGGGWILSDVDTWHQCPDHYNNQRHPEDEPLDESELVRLAFLSYAYPDVHDQVMDVIYPLSKDDIPF